MNRILVVEDEKPILNLIRMNLLDAGYGCVCAENGLEAADILEQEIFDLAILDIMLPGLNGYELLEYMRPMQIPVIFLTAKSDVADRVRGLKLGAEDYMVKPFEIVELLARVETVLRRYHKTSRILSVYDIEVDTLSRVVRKGGQPVSLTAKEYEILVLFLRNKNIALFRDRIYESVWGDMYMGDSRTVDLHVQRMRKKLGLESRIVPVYKIGYRLEVDR
ncbi:response regulator transcription factor [Frisingicoccus sp.]|uniref:response regulator transcription factor n=1 Tax=Frisingicoccus sp. TaxID=1918627 RepID=UPI002E75DCE2|nr:response regulator transcription factor [Frisingicoccus sp.]MEE0751776.1 response regulator transcription factor [Frisingicoccus sp.]